MPILTTNTLNRTVDVITNHLERFAFRENPEINWLAIWTMWLRESSWRPKQVNRLPSTLARDPFACALPAKASE